LPADCENEALAVSGERRPDCSAVETR